MIPNHTLSTNEINAIVDIVERASNLKVGQFEFQVMSYEGRKSGRVSVNRLVAQAGEDHLHCGDQYSVAWPQFLREGLPMTDNNQALFTIEVYPLGGGQDMIGSTDVGFVAGKMASIHAEFSDAPGGVIMTRHTWGRVA